MPVGLLPLLGVLCVLWGLMMLMMLAMLMRTLEAEPGTFVIFSSRRSLRFWRHIGRSLSYVWGSTQTFCGRFSFLVWVTHLVILGSKVYLWIQGNKQGLLSIGLFKATCDANILGYLALLKGF